jgi:hypothetical protein
MIRRAVHSNRFKVISGWAVHQLHVDEELTHVNGAHLEHAVSAANKHSPGMSLCCEPAPHKPLTNIQTVQLRGCEVMFDRFLQDDYIDFVRPEVVLKQGSAPTSPEPTDIPEEAPHWETLPKARAWRVTGL